MAISMILSFIHHRVCAHGESFAEITQVQPELHHFPFLNISKSSSLQVSVASLPRQHCIPQPVCYNLLHNTGSIGKAKTKIFSESETGHKRRKDHVEHERQTHKYGPKYGYEDQGRYDHVYNMHERNVPYERHRQGREYQRESEDSSAHRQLWNVVDNESRRGSLEYEWNMEAIQQRKAQVRNSNKLRDSPKLFRNLPGNFKSDLSLHPSEYEAMLPQANDDLGSTDDLFTPLTSLVCSDGIPTRDRIQNIVCENVRESKDEHCHEKLVELEEGLSSLKLHHIPAMPCTAFCDPQRERTESRSTSVGSTESDGGIQFTARPCCETLGSDWDEQGLYESETDPCETDSPRNSDDNDSSCNPENSGDVFENLQSYTEDSDLNVCSSFVRDSGTCVTSLSKIKDMCSNLRGSSNSLYGSSNSLHGSTNSLHGSTHSLHGSSNSLVSLDSSLCHQPNADLCYIPSNGARVSAEECAARRRHVSGNSQDGLESTKSASSETLTNQSAILGEGESQCFNAAVFKNKSLLDSNSVKSSPNSSPKMSPRRASITRGRGVGLDDFKPDITAPFSNGATTPVRDQQENSDSAFQFPPVTKGKSLLRNVLNKSHQVEEVRWGIMSSS